MDNDITPETESKIRALCDEIASAKSLNPDIHEELYTHIEDKILGYLSGEETLSEPDAFLLAREHFGDGVIVNQHQPNRHLAGPPIRFFRRLVLAALVQVLIISGILISRQLITMAYGLSEFGKVPFETLYYCTCILLILGQHKVLLSWKAREARGEPNWYEQWSTVQILGLPLSIILIANVSTILIGFGQLSNSVGLLWNQDLPRLLSYASPVSVPFIVFYALFAVAIIVIPIVTWLKWFDTRPQHRKSLGPAVLAYIFVPSVIAAPFSLFSLHETTVGATLGVVLFKLDGVSLSFSLSESIFVFGSSAVIIAMPAWATWRIYEAWNRRRGNGRDEPTYVIQIH
jgi:hypothetical protein